MPRISSFKSQVIITLLVSRLGCCGQKSETKAVTNYSKVTDVVRLNSHRNFQQRLPLWIFYPMHPPIFFFFLIIYHFSYLYPMSTLEFMYLQYILCFHHFLILLIFSWWVSVFSNEVLWVNLRHCFIHISLDC